MSWKRWFIWDVIQCIVMFAAYITVLAALLDLTFNDVIYNTVTRWFQ